MNISIYHIHHGSYRDDLPFWHDVTQKLADVLELGCGMGRVAISLAEDGRSVWGMDHDWEMLQSAKKVLSKSSPTVRDRVHLFVMDMTSFHVMKTFDGVLSPCNTYSLFSEEDRRSILSCAAGHLCPGGLFVVSIPNPHHLKAIREEGKEDDELWDPVLEGSLVHPHTGNPVQVSSHLAPTREGVKWTWIYDHLFPDGRVKRTEVSREHIFTSVDQYLSEFAQGGFSVQLYGDFNRSSFTKQSPYLIVRAEKSL